MTVDFPRHPPDAPALVTPGGGVTWAAWERQIDAAAARLERKAPRGGLVAVFADDPVETAALVLGTLRAGVALVPLSPHLPPAAVADALARTGAVLLDDGRAADPGRLPLEIRGRSAVVVFTSGSTGEPKAAVLTADALVASAAGVSEALGLGAGDRWLLDLPLNHVGGLGVVVRAALAGAALAVPARGTPTAAALSALAPTHASLVSTQLYRLLRDADAVRFPALRAVLLGGSGVAPALLDAAVARGLPVATSYGLTEMASTVTATVPGADRDALATSGRALPGRVLRVVNGEIRVGGAPLFAGYLRGGRLDRPLGADALFATGDLGRLDEAGRLVVTGRRGNRFVSGGENVQPEAVEAALAALPGVVCAVVVPVPDAEFGQRGVAFVEVEGGGAPDGARLAAALRERLPRFAVPARFAPWPPGPEGLKPSRARLAEVARRGL